MVTRTQIDKLSSRIEALAPRSDRIAYVWRNRGETDQEALERHYSDVPADRLAARSYIFSWLGV
jgi:hypothetical protein